MPYTRFKRYSNFSDGHGHTSKILVAPFCKLVFLYMVLLGMIISVLVCTYKIYIDAGRPDPVPDNWLIAEFLDDLPQNDSRLVNFIRDFHVIEASKDHPSNRTSQSGYNGVNTKIRQLLGKLENGFFVEANAGDGETGSNTKILEMNHGWTGVLIEPSIYKFQKMVSISRKAALVNSCLSTSQHSSLMEFSEPLNFSLSEPRRSSSRKLQTVKRRCFPLFSILAAVESFKIDYLSLSVDGKELQILETLPFDSVLIKVISVSYSHIPEGGDALRDFLVSKGYRLVGEAQSQFIFIWQSQSEISEDADARNLDDSAVELSELRRSTVITGDGEFEKLAEDSNENQVDDGNNSLQEAEEEEGDDDIDLGIDPTSQENSSTQLYLDSVEDEGRVKESALSTASDGDDNIDNEEDYS